MLNIEARCVCEIMRDFWHELYDARHYFQGEAMSEFQATLYEWRWAVWGVVRGK